MGPGGGGGSSDILSAPKMPPWNWGPLPCPNPRSPIFLSLHSQYSSLLRAGAEVALHLSLVHPVQGQHHEDTPEGQGPESMMHKRVWV